MAKFSFIPREEKFYQLFEQMAETMVLVAQEFKKLVDNWENVEIMVNRITEIEHEADSTTHQIMYQLNRTFVTPFDREDIALLAHSMDDVIDLIQAAADTMLLYKVKVPGQRAKELAENIFQITSEVQKAVPQLKQRGDVPKMLKLCVEINRLENAADKIFRAALTELFEDTTDIVDIIKWREIYHQMEAATDKCEDVADILEGVTLKYA